MTTTDQTILVRPAQYSDRVAICAAEAKSTPGLRYVDQVFELFMDRTQGEFLVAEIAGEIVACGKFTIVPDGSAWLETLRVTPECQGLGIGKRFYEEFFAIARRTGVSTMRMYTGTKNAVSKGLAERFGFQLAETFAEARLPCSAALEENRAHTFEAVTDADWATEHLLAQSELWHNFLVMNRTFYQITPALCTMLIASGQLYYDAAAESIAVLGARFMPQEALHIGLFGTLFGGVSGGANALATLRFAQQLGCAVGAERINCIFPSSSAEIKQSLLAAGFQMAQAELIVMETTVPSIDSAP